MYVKKKIYDSSLNDIILNRVKWFWLLLNMSERIPKIIRQPDLTYLFVIQCFVFLSIFFFPKLFELENVHVRNTKK